MALFENFPWTNLHQLNLNWIIEEVKKCYSPDNPPEAMVISVNGESGVVTLYKNAHVALPDITEEQWNIYRGSAQKITGIEFNKDNPATRINGNQRFVIYDAGNPPPYPVIAVNGETGNVILYEEPYAVFPDIEGDNWGLERKLNKDTADETRVGIMFDDDGNAYVTHDEDAVKLLTIEDIPSSSGVVSVNGMNGIVSLTGSNIPTSPTDNVTLDQKVSTINQNISGMAQNISGIENDISDIEGDVSTLQTNVSGLQSSVTTLQNNFVQSKSGTVAYSGLKGGGWADRVTVHVTFATPMQSTDYRIFINLSGSWADFPYITAVPSNQTVNGFDIIIVNVSGNNTEVTGNLYWYAVMAHNN